MQVTTLRILPRYMGVFGAFLGIWGLTPVTLQAEEYVIPIETFGGRPVLQITFGNYGNVPLVMDTGARGVVIDRKIGEEMGFSSVGEALLKSPGGDGIPAMVYEPMSLTINGYTFTPSHLIGMDFTEMRRGPEMNRPVRDAELNPEDLQAGDDYSEIPPGVIGFWEFREGVVEVDFGARNLIVDTEATLDPTGDHVLSLETKPGFPYPQFEMTVAGMAVNGHVDTGAPGTFIMSTDWMENLPLKGKPEKLGQARMADGLRDIWSAQLDGSVTVGGYTLKDPEIKFLKGVSGVNVGSGFFLDGGFKVDRENNLIEFNRIET